MSGFCGSKFWDWELSWNTVSSPDFTICFEETALVWIPCAVLWILSIYEIYAILTDNNKNPIPWTIFTITKILLTLVLFGISLAEMTNALITYLNDNYFVNLVDFYTPFIKSITFIYVVILTLSHRKHGIHSSGALFIFWFLLMIGSVFNYRTIINIIYYSTPFKGTISYLTYTTKMIYFPIIVAQFLLSCFSDSTNGDLSSSKNDKPCPENSASFLSKITFWWFNGMIIKGYKKPLTTDDMWSLNRKNLANSILRKFNKVWIPTFEREKEKAIIRASKGEPLITEVSLLSSVLKTFWPGMLFVGFIKLIASVLTFVNPLVLDRLIGFMSPDNNEPEWRGYFYASLMFISPFFESLLNGQYEYRINLICMKIRACVISIIYKKSLKLSSSGRKDFTTGEIVNLMSVDSQRIIDFFLMINTLWSAPLQMAIALYLLWQQLGIATLAGMIFMIVLLPFNGYITTKMRLIQMRVMKEKDKRVKLMNEILNGIKVLKLYAWENSFRDQVMSFRDKEVKSLNSMAYLSGAMVFTFVSAPFFVGLFSFATFILISSDNILDANKAFVSLSLFNIMRLPLGWLPILLSMGAMFLVSLRRIDKYLNADEIDENAISRNQNIKTPIVVENGTFAWSKGSNPVLNNISLQIKPKKLVAIVGRVGSGKSSLLSALLGDLEKLKGNVNINGKVAYVPQQAWIQNQTLRQNIIFVNEFNENHYKEVLESCALEPDLKILSAGDMTEIGEKGINLSGGQKQRVSLARAVYANADIYLMDDPLSAVDTHVGRHLFERAIGPKSILKDKTRVLVTHRVSILPEVDQIIVVKDGTISESGSFDELIANKGDFAEFVAEYLIELTDSDIDKEETELLDELTEKVKPIIERALSRSESQSHVSDGSFIRKRKISMRSQSVISNKDKSDKSESIKPEKPSSKSRERPDGKLIEAETSETGNVKLRVYKNYLQMIGLPFSLIVILSFASSNVAQIFSGLWLSQWSNDALDPNKANDNNLRDLRLGVYAGIGSVETIFNLFASILVNLACIRAAKILHNNMLKRIMKAPMSFFDTTPIGRILNRFSKDIDTADMSLLFNLRMTILQFFRTLVAFTMISLETPIILAAIFPLAVIYYIFQRIYISTSRQLKRIDSTSRSPIYNHFSETVNGSTSIRAYGVCDLFINESNKRVDENHICYYPSFTAARWLAIRLEFVGYCIIFLSAIFAVLSRGSLSPGIAGLAISYSLNITGVLGMFVRVATDLETNIVSVERCLEYTETPLESELFNEFTKPNNKWPEKGEINFQNYSTRYRDGLELVLKKISLEVNPSEKVGIVGRTGAGKSSLTLALFRLIEPTDGTIFIDSVDIRKLGLYDLRSRLTIIPQDPALFTGTLRMNLDPFDQYSDEQIWNALELSHLKTFVSSLQKGLSHEISEGGENLSVGQKQLVCLARALLRKTKILVLDEATAAVDMETDDLIQETIRKEFSGSTIVTIAHRLNTIIDYDRVLVMDKGEVAEFDSPKLLLENTNSIFYSMAKDANLLPKSQ